MEHDFQKFDLVNYEYLILNYNFIEYYVVKEVIEYGYHEKLGEYCKVIIDKNNNLIIINPYQNSYFFIGIPKYDGFNQVVRKSLLQKLLFDARIISQVTYSIKGYLIQLDNHSQTKTRFLIHLN